MAVGSVRIIKRFPKPEIIFGNIQAEIAKQLHVVGRQHVNERKKVVSNFETDIDFGYEVKISPKQITLEVSVLNASEQVSEGFTVGDLWKALDKTGVKPHLITAKKQGGKLAFQTGYQPHTRPIARSGGPGRPTGDRVFRKQVKHPGFPPRKFSETINKRLRRQFEQAIDRGFRLGSRKRR